MHSDALKVFVTICRQGGFVAAADHLNRSQPAVSRRIALLEEEVGAPLDEMLCVLMRPAKDRMIPLVALHGITPIYIWTLTIG